MLGPGTDAMRHGDGGAEARLIAGSAFDVAALLTSTVVSVFKPRRRRARTNVARQSSIVMRSTSSPRNA